MYYLFFIIKTNSLLDDVITGWSRPDKCLVMWVLSQQYLPRFLTQCTNKIWTKIICFFILFYLVDDQLTVWNSVYNVAMVQMVLYQWFVHEKIKCLLIIRVKVWLVKKLLNVGLTYWLGPDTPKKQTKLVVNNLVIRSTRVTMLILNHRSPMTSKRCYWDPTNKFK